MTAGDVDDVMREVERQVTWQLSVEASHHTRLRRPMAQVPDPADIDIDTLLRMFGRDLIPIEGSP